MTKFENNVLHVFLLHFLNQVKLGKYAIEIFMFVAIDKDFVTW